MDPPRCESSAREGNAAAPPSEASLLPSQRPPGSDGSEDDGGDCDGLADAVESSALKIQRQHRRHAARGQRRRIREVRDRIEEAISGLSTRDVMLEVAARYGKAVEKADPTAFASTLTPDAHLETYNGAVDGRPAVRETLHLWCCLLGSFRMTGATYNPDNDTVAVVYTAAGSSLGREVLVVDTLAFSPGLCVAYIDRLVAREPDIMSTAFSHSFEELEKRLASQSYLARSNCRTYFRREVAAQKAHSALRDTQGVVRRKRSARRRRAPRDPNSLTAGESLAHHGGSAGVPEDDEECDEGMCRLQAEADALRLSMQEGERAAWLLLGQKDRQLAMLRGREEYRVAYLRERVRELEGVVAEQGARIAAAEAGDGVQQQQHRPHHHHHPALDALYAGSSTPGTESPRSMSAASARRIARARAARSGVSRIARPQPPVAETAAPTAATPPEPAACCATPAGPAEPEGSGSAVEPEFTAVKGIVATATATATATAPPCWGDPATPTGGGGGGGGSRVRPLQRSRGGGGGRGRSSSRGSSPPSGQGGGGVRRGSRSPSGGVSSACRLPPSVPLGAALQRSQGTQTQGVVGVGGAPPPPPPPPPRQSIVALIYSGRVADAACRALSISGSKGTQTEVGLPPAPCCGCTSTGVSTATTVTSTATTQRAAGGISASSQTDTQGRGAAGAAGAAVPHAHAHAGRHAGVGGAQGPRVATAGVQAEEPVRYATAVPLQRSVIGGGGASPPRRQQRAHTAAAQGVWMGVGQAGKQQQLQQQQQQRRRLKQAPQKGGTLRPPRMSAAKEMGLAFSRGHASKLPPIPPQSRACRDYWEIFRCWRRLDPDDTGSVPVAVLQEYWDAIFQGRTGGRLVDDATIAVELGSLGGAGYVDFAEFTSFYLQIVAPISFA